MTEQALKEIRRTLPVDKTSDWPRSQLRGARRITAEGSALLYSRSLRSRASLLQRK